MATIILDRAASDTSTFTAELTPQDGDIYILQSDAVNEFRFLGDADFEVRIEDAGPYSQGTGQVTLSFEDTTNPTVIYANGVDAQRVGLNANGDSLTVNAGDNVTLGPIIGSGEERIPSMPSGDGLNADGGGLTITTGSGTIVTSTIDGPSSGADANYTFGEGNEFWTGATVTGSVGGNTTIVVGDNAVVSANAGFVAPLGDLNGNTQSITIGNNAVNDPGTQPAWEVTVAGTNGEKIIDIGDNVTVGEVGFGSEGTVSNANGFDNNTTFVNPTGGTLTAGENLTVTEFIWGTEGGSTYILGDGWDVPFDLSGAGENNGDDPADKLILGEPAIQGGDTGVLIGSGNDQISIMPPTSSPAETAAFIDSATAAQWAENDDGSWSPTIANSNDLVYDMGIYSFGAGSPGVAPNQIVDGENDAEFMGDGYDDANGPTNSGGDIIDGADGDNDVILGNGGNDTINAGAGTDEVYGGSGNDVIDGGAGNDTLTGDFASDVTDTVVDNSTVEGDDILEGGAGDDIIYGDSGNSLSAGGDGVPEDTLGDGPGSTGGGYDRVTAQSVSNGNHSFSTDAFYLGNDIPVLDDANRDAITGVSFSQDGDGTDRTFGLDELEFIGAQRSFVGLVTVQDSDVSGANDQFSSSISGGFQDTTVVSSGTADFTMNDGQVFQGIRVNYVRGPDGETYMMPDDGPSPGAFNSFRNMLASNNSGIDSFTIATGSGDDAGINPIEGNWADGQFFETVEGDGGDDTITGGEGADTLFGEGGDDTFVVSSAAEGAGDVISGGTGPDENTDNDVLDLTGAGQVAINATADANDAGAQSGTVTFEDGSTLTFEGIETIIQDPDNTAPKANDDVTSTLEGTAVQVNLLANDTDAEGDDLDIQGTPTATNGTITVDNETGELTYTPNPGFVGEETITYTVVDEDGLTDTATLTVNVAAEPADGPVAVDDNISVFESEAAGDTDGNVLTNDLQEAGEPGPYAGSVVTVNGTTGQVGEWIDLPDGGRVQINDDGTFDFDADGDFEDLNDGESREVELDYTIQTTSNASSGPNAGQGSQIDVNGLSPVVVGSQDQETFNIGSGGDLLGGVPINITGNLIPTGLFFGTDNDTIDISDAVADGWTPTEVIKTPDQLLFGNGFNGSFVLTKPGELPVAVTYLEIENFVGFDTVVEEDEATLTVTVLGENDAPELDPIADQTMPENSTDPVFTPTATDPDGDPVTYSLSGDDADLFDIDPTTGEVTPVAPLDFETPADANGDGIYDITVVATDPDGLSDEEPVAITVDDVNEAPVLEDIGPQTAPENSTDPVFTANAVDPDGDQPIYSLSGPDADLFDIDPDTGEVTPVAPLDADNPTDDNGDGVYDITVVATDPNDPTLNDEEPVQITVGDVNEAPVIDPIDDTSIDENSTDPVFTPTATDPDGDPVTYSLSGDDADLFDIDPTTGEVTPVAPLDFETPADANGDGIYDITVVATDPDGLSDEEPVAITVDDVNEAPVLEDIGPQTAPENSTDPVFTANAVDPDGDQPIYSLSGPDADLFDIDPDTGEVTPVAPLDADNPTDDNGDGVYDITVVATDPNDPTLNDEEPVQITVGDVNEAPVIDPIDDTSIDENSTDPVFTPTATDPDGDPVTYSLSGDDADLFDIDPTTGEVTPVAPLDFETPADANGDGIYDITVVATDPDGLSDEEPVAITVDDVNEAPVLEDIGPQTAPENSTDPVFTANAVDPDGDQPIYSLSGPDADLFDIDPDTGEVTPVAPLDADNPTDDNGDGVYDITVVATDPNDPTLNDEEPVQITVGDVNEAPVIDPIDDTSIDENSTDPVFTPTATDPDGDPVTYSLSGDDADLFDIDPTTGEVTPVAPLDFETPADANGDGIYDITVVATDPDGLSDEEPVAITVDDVNEAPDAIDDRAETGFDTPVTIDVLDNDTDAEGDTLTIADATVPANQGTVSVVNGELLFTPADGFEGDATISYTVSDGDLTDTAEVVVTVGDNPADGVVDGAEDGEVMDPGYIDPQGDEIDGADGLDDTINGNGGDDDIDAGLGDDTVSGGEGDDIIDGNDGADTLDGNEGKDTMDGGDGDDVIDGGDDDDSITGGDGNDSVEGGNGNDVIDTSGPVDVDNNVGTPDIGYPGVFPGDDDPLNDLDTVFGGAGDDIISTGDDADSIDGGIGNDTIDGGIDADIIDGGDGDDRIVGGEGNDTIEGGDGNDAIYAGNDPDLGLDQFNIEDDGTNPLGPDLAPDNGDDLVFGGAGNDTIFGADDSDELYGGADDDVLDGGIDDDTLSGDEGNDTLIGGQGADEMYGGLGDDLFVVDQEGDGTDDVVVGGEDPDDNDVDVLDLTGANITSIVFTNDDPETESGVVTFADGGTLTFSEIETVIPCFTPGTFIATAKGERLVEELQPGDRIITRDNGFQEIAWVGAKQMSGLELAQRPSLKPVFVKAGSLGNGLPERDMMLSPNHKVLFASDQAELYFEENEVLVAAKHLIGKPGIQQVDVTQTTYIHFMFERHEVVLSDGAWSESFHPGDYSINGIDEDARNEILALFPELATDQGLNDYRLARTELKKHEARLLIG